MTPKAQKYHPRKWRYPFLFFCLLAGLLIASQLNNKYFKLSKNLEIFASILKELDTCYVDEIDSDSLVKTGIHGMLQSLDPYTNFIPEEALERFKTSTTGEYGGIGAVIGPRQGKTVLLMLYKGFPAHQGGLRVGDHIFQIDGEDVTDESTTHISELLQGTPQTQVQVTVNRPGTDIPVEVTLTREKVTLKNVPYFGKLQGETGYIRLANFTTHAADEVKAALEALKSQHIQKLVLDLRGNPGGILEEAIQIANIFIHQDLPVVATRGKLEVMTQTYTTDQPALDSTIPLVVLVDQQSASASEIVAGVLQDYDRAVLIGKRTFGKGLVQYPKPMCHNTQLKLTVARYYLPSGRSIQKIDYRKHRSTQQPDEAEQVPPQNFTTQAGRVVQEEDGIAPDLEGEKWELAPITVSLINKGLIFDYATHFQNHHEHIAPLKKFSLSTAQYQAFIAWLQDKDYAYSIEPSIDQLLQQTQSEGYTKDIQKHIDLLKTQVQHHKAKDLQKFKQEIMLVLQEAIIARYYFQEGAIEAMLGHDKNIQQALMLLQNMEQYHRLLAPSEAGPGHSELYDKSGRMILSYAQFPNLLRGVGLFKTLPSSTPKTRFKQPHIITATEFFKNKEKRLRMEKYVSSNPPRLKDDRTKDLSQH